MQVAQKSRYKGQRLFLKILLQTKFRLNHTIHFQELSSFSFRELLFNFRNQKSARLLRSHVRIVDDLRAQRDH